MEPEQPAANRRKRPNISDDEIIRLYESGLALRQVGEIAGISRQAVQVRLKKNGIARRVQTVTDLVLKADAAGRGLIDRETLDRLYTLEQKSPKAIASLLGVGQWVVRENLKYHRIPTRRKRLPGLDGRVILTANLLNRLHVRENLTVRQIAGKTSYTEAWVGRLLSKFGLLKSRK